MRNFDWNFCTSAPFWLFWILKLTIKRKKTFQLSPKNLAIKSLRFKNRNSSTDFNWIFIIRSSSHPHSYHPRIGCLLLPPFVAVYLTNYGKANKRIIPKQEIRILTCMWGSLSAFRLPFRTYYILCETSSKIYVSLYPL